jgi:5S rRNA maturation endonuclease (ribonuclease M5)
MNAPYAAEMVDLGARLWGLPNKALSTRKEARFGSNGSKSVDLEKATYYDHEAGDGGGYRKLYKLVNGEFPKNGNGLAGGKLNIVAEYDYRDHDGKLLFQVVRLSPKSFRKRRPNGNGGWTWNTADTEKVLYRLPELLAAPLATVYVVEGEKDVEALRQYLLVATCNPGGAETTGASKWTAAMSDSLRGRDVVVLPDNDEAGEKHAANIANSLKGKAKSVRIVRLPNLPDKGDVSDWLAAGGTVEELERLASEAPLHEPPLHEAPNQFPPLLSLADFMATYETPDYIVDGILQRGRLYALTSPTSHGKTAVAQLIGIHVAAKRNIGNIEVAEGPIVFLAGENPSDLCVRMYAACQAYGLDPIKVPLHVMPGNFPLTPEAAEELKGEINAKGINPVGIIFDTAASFFPAITTTTTSKRAPTPATYAS